MKWDPFDASWQEHYQALRKIKEAGEDVNVPRDSPTNPRLSRWLGKQRTSKCSGRLSAERTTLLTALGVVWQPRNVGWLKNYQALQAIKKAGGDVNIPRDYRLDPQLGAWLGNQRQSSKKGILSPDRIAQLEALGVVWEPRKKHDVHQ